MGRDGKGDRRFPIMAIVVGAAGVAIGAYSIYVYATGLLIQP